MTRSTTSTSNVTDVATHVNLTWRVKEIEQRLRFGHAVATARIDHELRRLSFTPGDVFAILRWSGNRFGTTASHIDILRAVGCGEQYTSVPGVEPGAASLLSISTWPKVERVLQTIDAVEAMGIDPADAATDYWHHVHNRVSVGEQPRPYTQTRHQAWIKRRSIAR
jgi:hypothetical protein